MQYIKSCGFIVYKQVGAKNYYLLIKSLNGDVGFPKGHMEEKETELQTALRELKEETNAEIEIIDGFRKQIEYKMPKMRNTLKQSVYFLGKYQKNEIIPQVKEVAEAVFLPYEKALECLTFTETKNILICAQNFLNNLD